MHKALFRRLTMVMILAASVAVASRDAQAAPVIQAFSCTQGIQQITWDGGGLFIDCIGQPNRFAAYSFNPCTGVFGTMDNIKVFEALATSAFLSGRLLVVTYATPASCVGGGVGAITALTISR
jgi:hypothetical protein